MGEVGNYSAHAIDNIKSLPYMRIQEPQLVLRLLEAAVKFHLPGSGILMDGDVFRTAFLELFHIPFPICALEYWMGDDRADRSNPLQVGEARRRIALCFDPSALPPVLRNEFLDVLGCESIKLPSRAVAVISLFHRVGAEFGLSQGWQFIPAVGVIDLDSESLGIPVLLFDKLVKMMSKAHAIDPQTLRKNYISDLADEVSTTWQFLAAANCSNVGIERMPAPE